MGIEELLDEDALSCRSSSSSSAVTVSVIGGEEVVVDVVMKSMGYGNVDDGDLVLEISKHLSKEKQYVLDMSTDALERAWI